MLNDDWKYDEPRKEYYFNDKDLAEHDSELLDKVAEKLKAKYPIYFNEFGMVINNTLQEDIDEVIVDMKAEVSENANES